MKVDTAGNVYCTGPAGIHVIDPDGNLLGRMKIPGHVTNMAWGDAEGLLEHASVLRLEQRPDRN